MQPSSEGIAAERARWLAELAAALAEARRMVEELGVSEARLDAIEVHAQIENLRFQVQRMQLSRANREPIEFAPELVKSPWHAGAADAEEFPSAA